MPQPFDTAKSYQLRSDALLVRPQLATRIAIITALASSIEFLLGAILSRMLIKDPVLGARLYTELRSTRSQRDLVEKIASQAMPTADFRSLSLILKQSHSCAKLRSRVVHSVWGLSDAYPDNLIAVPVDSLVKQYAFQVETFMHGASTQEDLSNKAEKSSHPNIIMIYSEKDFIFIEKKQNELLSSMGHFLKSFDRAYWDAIEKIQSSLSKS